MKEQMSVNEHWVVENLFKWVNCVIPLRYLNKFSKNMQPQNIMFNLTPHILMLESPHKNDFRIMSIIK